MPYIHQSLRPDIDNHLDPLIDRLCREPPEFLDGMVVYIIYKLLRELYTYQGGFFSRNRANGVIASAGQEFYRRCVAPYEDEKIAENGDV